MVAGAVAQGVGVMAHEVGEDERLLAELLQRLENGGELKVFPLRGRRPVLHHHAVGHVHGTESRDGLGSRFRCDRQCRHHRIEERQRQCHTNATKHGPSWNEFLRDNHLNLSPSVNPARRPAEGQC